MILARLRDCWETLRRITEYVAGHERAFLASGSARLRLRSPS
jgi:hypothetical protein